MELALQAALLGAVLGGAVLAAAALYGWTLPQAPNAYGWWAAAFTIDTVGRAVMLQGASPLTAELADMMHALSALPSLIGALTLGRRRPTRLWLIGGVAVVLAWIGGLHILRMSGWVGSDLPALGLGGVPLLVAANHFRGRRPGEDGNILAVVSFAGAGLVQLATPFLSLHHGAMAWALFVGQALAVLMALALVLEVLQRQHAQALSEGERAAQAQTRLREALDRTNDGIALFDAQDRLISANGRYLDFLAPLAHIIRPGLAFADLVAAETDHGVLRQVCPVPPASGRPADAGSPLGVEAELSDGRWVAVHDYPTGDGGRIRLMRDVTARRQITESLQDSIAWLQGIMETVVDGIIAIDRAGVVLSFNDAARRIFGYEASEVLGRNVSMLMPSPFRDEHDGYIRRYQETGEARIIGIGRQVRGLRKDGSVFPLELAVTQMRRDAKETTYIGLVRDITERKRVEDALVESEQRFRDLAESASDWFWELDGDLRFTFVSGRVRQVLGVGPSHFIGRPFADLVGECENPADWPVQQTLMEGRRAFRGFIFRHVAGDGGVRFVEMAGRPVLDVGGGFAGYRGTATDITPLKRHEQELAAQSALRQAIIDNMGQGVVVFDGEERLVALNRQARSLLALPAGEVDTGMSTLEGLALFLAAHGEFGPGAGLAKVRRRLVRLRRAPRQVFEHARPNGMVLEVRSTAMPGGGLIWTLTDITERKKAEATLREAKDAAEHGNRAKATFLANISHELRTPLNAIIGFSELMKHQIFGPLEPVAYRAYVDDVHESGMHLLELINDILDMSKAEAGMTDLAETLVDVAALTRAALRMMERRAQAHDLTLSATLPDHLPWLLADERRVRQILLNLLSNAVKFTEDGGQVEVSAWVEPRGMVIEVADSGIGMSPEDLERVMEPFVQADTRLSRKYEGTGLGLPLTRALIQAHGGVMVMNSRLDHGTRVQAVFPTARLVDSVDPVQAHTADALSSSALP